MYIHPPSSQKEIVRSFEFIPGVQKYISLGRYNLRTWFNPATNIHVLLMLEIKKSGTVLLPYFSFKCIAMFTFITKTKLI